jgi:aminopeptidase N
MPRLIAGKFDTKETERNGIKVRVSIYGSASSHAVSSYTEAAYTLIDVYGKALVPYPRKELDIMEFKYLGFYQSPPGLVMVPSEPPGGPSVVESRSADYHLRTFMHELAHQWFGNIVIPKSWDQDNWISESIAEYLAALVYSKGAKDPKDSAQKMQMAVDGWRRKADESKDSVSIAQASFLRGDWTDQYTFIDLLYGKGPLVVRMLHTTMGDDRFWTLLQTMLTKYAYKEVSTDDFGKEASLIVGQDMTWFFNQWIKQPGIPDLDVTKSLKKGGGKTVLSGHLKQHDPAHFKMLLLPFVFETGGSRAVKLVLMDKPEMDYSAELPADAANVVLDPGRNNLVYYH